MYDKTLCNMPNNEAKKNVSDLKTYGKSNSFKLLCKASSDAEGWMKSTKVLNLPNGCVMQVSSFQKNKDGSNSLAEALTFIPGCNIGSDGNMPTMILIPGDRPITKETESKDIKE